MNAAVTVEIFGRVWFSMFLAPRAVLTDRGGVFRSAMFDEFVTQQLGAYHVYSSPYYPQGNGMNEASYIALQRSIAAAMRESNDMSYALREAVKIHNATPHFATRMSPFFFMFGQEMCFPGWQVFRQQVNLAQCKVMR
eukprot:Lankesteria_metandrocarpae@DN5471_c1_g3_i5.p1